MPIASVLSNIFRGLISDKEHKELHRNIEKVLGFRPGNHGYYELAILHSSAVHNNKIGLDKHNERLEFLGDSVLDLVIADVLFEKYPDKDEGALTKLRSTMVNRTSLNKIASDIGLDKLIIGNFSRNIIPEDVKGNALEAMLGAIYIDKGFKFTHKYIKSKIIPRFSPLNGEQHEWYLDYKSELFMWSQKNKQQLVFETVGDIGKGEKKKYIINVIVEGKVLGTGEGPSKKKAQQAASRNACKRLNLSLGNYK